MNQEDLLTDLGKHLFDYSSIRKTSIPNNVLEDIISSYTIRNELNSCTSLVVDDLLIYQLDEYATLDLYSDWRSSFMSHGYDPPILYFNEPESTNN